MAIVFIFMQESQPTVASAREGTREVTKFDVFIVLDIYLNGETKNNLTAVFYFNNTNTYDTDNCTLNRDFLNYFTQRLETIRNQVSGIKAFPLEYLGINWTSIFPVFENTSNFDINFEQTNKSESLFLEEWYILSAEAGILIVDYFPPDPRYKKILENPEVLATIIASIIILSLYLKKGKHHNRPGN